MESKQDQESTALPESPIIEKTRAGHVLSVHCKRLHERMPVAEHLRCPYCFGHKQEVAAGEHERFCDFDPARDPHPFRLP